MKRIKCFFIIFILFAASLSIVSCSPFKEENGQGNESDFEINILSTGKSDFILIECDGLVIVNDTAEKDDFGVISTLFSEKKIDAIDYMIISHFDKDHIGCASEIINKYDVKCVISPDYKEDSDLYNKLSVAVKVKKCEYLRLTGDYEIKTENSRIRIDAPDKKKYSDANDYSLVTFLTYKDKDFVFMGDSAKERCAEISSSLGASSNIDFIKMPHHGFYYKNLKNILILTSPEYAVITTDKEKTDLKEDTLSVLSKINAKTFFTCDGNVCVTIEKGEIKVTQ